MYIYTPIYTHLYSHVCTHVYARVYTQARAAALESFVEMRMPVEPQRRLGFVAARVFARRSALDARLMARPELADEVRAALVGLADECSAEADELVRGSSLSMYDIGVSLSPALAQYALLRRYENKKQNAISRL